MTPEQLSQLEKSVRETIEKTVNGKITRLDQKLEEYIQRDEQWKTEDNEWKKTVQPVVDAYLTANRIGDFVQWISKVIVAVGVIIGVLFYSQNK